MKKALIVDDIKENLYLLDSLLKAYGYKTILANNGAEALGLALNEPPDIIISDILMPVMDGYTLCREWKKDDILKNIPFVFYTATYTHPKDGEFALSLGADKFMVKPQEPDIFMELIEQVLAEFRNGKMHAAKPTESTEITLLKEYNETLIRKMEARMLKSEEAEKKIRIYAEQLEAEIEQRKQALLALKESETKFRILAESAPVGIFTTDKLGRTNYVNPRWCEISKLTHEEALDNGWLKATHPDDREKLALLWQQDSISGNASKAEYRFIHPDGSVEWVIGQAVPQKNEHDVITGYIGTITDITERKKMESDLIRSKEKAEESDRLKTAFLTNMSHEIRTPMNGILGFLELLNTKNLDDNSRQQYMQVVNLSGQRLLDTINDIIEISKIEAGENELKITTVAISEIFKYYIDFFLPQAKQKGLSLSIAGQFSDNKIVVETDKYKLESIISNLLKNALKFTSRGTIQLGNYIENESLVFYVKDTGRGIPADKIDAIFKRFIQAETGLNRSYEGSGLGLTIAKAYIQLMGGKIWVESEVDKGSTFYFSIPYKLKSEKIDLPVDKNEPDENIFSGKTILVAEDDDTSFQYLEVILKQKNILLLRAKNGKEAIKMVMQNEDISIVLMDLKMPEMDGLEATKEIRKFNKTIPIIAQTAFALSGDKEMSLQTGCNAYISKPIKSSELFSILYDYLCQQTG